MKTLKKALALAAIAVFGLSTSTQAKSDFDRKTMFAEVGYFATTFDDMKLSGHYGISYTHLPWGSETFSVGYNLSPFNFNWGLADSDYTSDIIMAGPAVGLHFGEAFSLILPIDVTCAIGFGGDESSTSWGLSLSPAVYVGKKVGVYVGPFFSLPFNSEGDTKFSTGLRAGLFF